MFFGRRDRHQTTTFQSTTSYIMISMVKYRTVRG